MRLVVLYHPHSDHEGTVLDYARDYKRFRNRELELLSVDTRDGWSMASLYDITNYPAILVLADDGVAQHIWQGLPLPLMNDLDSYAKDFRTGLSRAELLSEPTVN